jgi:hypothetical protein
MKRLAGVIGLAAALAAPLSSGSAQADNTTYTLQCGATTYTVVKPNESAAVYTNGTLQFVTAIGTIIGDGTAPPNAVLCTINGFGPLPFIVTAV